MKLFRFVAVTALVIGSVLALSGIATSEVARKAAPGAGGCKGLTCAQAGDHYYVPEARQPDGSVGGPADLQRQTEAGFYEYTPLPSATERAVAYVIPPGELDSAPESVRALPNVATVPSSELATATAVVFEPGALLVVLDRDTVRSRSSRNQKDGPMLTRRDASQCNAAQFCLWDCQDQYYGAYCYSYLRLSAETLPPAAGWKNLAQWNFANKAESMVNNRDKDNKLAQQTGGGGAHYCADSHSEDDSFGNNSPGNNEAESVRASDDDAQC